MSRDLEFRVEGGAELRRLARELRDLEDGKEILKQLRKDLKKIANERMVPAVKQAALSIPSKGQSSRRGRRSLRTSIARATQARVRSAGRSAGVTIWVSPRRMPEGQHNLPAYMEGMRPFQRWRHPRFGDTDHWYTQRAHPYFYKTIRPLEGDAQDAALRAVDAVANRIERG